MPTYKDSQDQYINDRDSKETLFSFNRCIAHFYGLDENFITFENKIIDGKNTRLCAA